MEQIIITGLKEHQIKNIVGEAEHYEIDYFKVDAVEYLPAENGTANIVFRGQEKFNFNINWSVEEFLLGLSGKGNEI